jgi:hypothetical protein
MNRQNNYTEVVSSFSLELFTEQLMIDPAAVFKKLEALAERKLSVIDTGVDRKLIHVWRKKGLLPFKQEDGWGRFSFIELCWIKTITELRKVGVGLDKLLEIKNFFFSEDFINKFFNSPVDNLNALHPDFANLAKEKLQFDSKNKLMVQDSYKSDFEEIQFSLFTVFIYIIMMKRSNCCLYLDSEGKYDVLDLNELMNNSFEVLPKLYDFFSNNTIAMVNMKKIVADISNTHELFSKVMKLPQLLSDNSVDLLQKLFKDNQVKEITFRITENGRPTMLVKQEISLNELRKEVIELNKKGTFRDILVKTRNGNVQYFEKTDIIKL